MNQLRGPRVRVGRSRVRLNVYWVITGLLLAAMTGWFLADLLFDSPGAAERTLGALLAALALTLSIAIRELAQPTLSRQFDPQRRHMVLYPSGTMPASYHVSRSPGTEIRQALVGPAVSLGAGLIFLAPLLALSLDALPGRLFAGFGLLNITAALVTIMPAFPFSGGQILRAAFWYFHDSHISGTKIAFLYGQIVAAVGLGYGAFLLSWQSSLLVPGLWCVALGWLVVRASRTELLRSHMIDRAAQIRAADAVAGLNPTIRASDVLANAIDILLEQRNNGPGLVRDRDRFVGVLTLSSVRDVSRSDWKNVHVRDVMAPFTQFEDTQPDARLLEVLRIRIDLEDRPVIVRHPGGQIAGLISNEINPGVLLRRGEERSVDLQHADHTRSRSTGA